VLFNDFMDVVVGLVHHAPSSGPRPGTRSLRELRGDLFFTTKLDGVGKLEAGLVEGGTGGPGSLASGGLSLPGLSLTVPRSPGECV
jgi:hypothetical protein